MGFWLGGLVVGGMGGCERRLESIVKMQKSQGGEVWTEGWSGEEVGLPYWGVGYGGCKPRIEGQGNV